MAKRHPIHWAWVILATCFADLFINYSVRLGYGVALPEMLEDLGLSRSAGASIYNAYLFAYLSLTPLTGILTDRLGARGVITTCSLILGIGAICMGTAGSAWTASLAYAVVGMGASGMWTPVVTVVQRWFVSGRRGLALGVLSTGYGLGFAAVGVAFPWIVRQFSWRHSWYFLGMGALAMVFVNVLLLRSSPEAAGVRPWGGSERSARGTVHSARREGAFRLKTVFSSRLFWMIGLSYFSISYCLYGITTFMVDYARSQIGLSLEKASLLAAVHGICQVIGVLTILPLSDFLGRRRTILFSNAFIALCMAGILFAGETPGMLFWLVGILAVFYGATFPIYGACAGDYFPGRVMGTVVGAWTPFYGLGAILVHWVTGAIRDATGRYDWAFAVNAVMAAVAVVAMAAVRERKG